MLLGVLLGFSAVAPQVLAQYQLVWEDNFAGSNLDLGKWQAQIGTGCPSNCGWGNNELQYYRAENATVAGGYLTITARAESFGGRSYTSARLRTRNLGDWERGRFEMRAKLPIDQGIWPAFWMLPTDSVYGVWAASGEIDIMECVGHEPNRVHGTLHYGGTWPGNVASGGNFTLPSGTFHDQFHVFALEWDEQEMRWYVDGTLYSVKSSWWSSGGSYPAPFDERFHLLLNLAVGGNWPGSPNASTVFPQSFVVDYVRVYQDLGPALSNCLLVFDDMEHADPFANGYFLFNGSVGGGGIGSNTALLPPALGGSASLAAAFTSGGAPGYFGGFGRTNPVDLSGATHFEMWIQPDAGQDYVLEINLQDDDDGDNAIPGNPNGADDEFQYALTVGPAGSEIVSSGGWQRVSIPLSEFVDDNTYHFGGNGILDPAPTSAGGNGQLVNVVFALISLNGTPVTFRTDRWDFTRRVSSISGRVWNDADGDGIGIGEPGLNGVSVYVFDVTLGAIVATEVTSGDGQYNFTDLSGDAVEIRVDPSTLPAGSTSTYDPDGVATPHQFASTPGCAASVTDGDFGYSIGSASNYCTGSPNSVGPGARMTSNGSYGIGAGDFALEVSGVIPSDFGLFVLGSSTADLQLGEGRLCVGGQLYRLLPPLAATAVGGTSRQLDFGSAPGSFVHPGTTWNFQYWYRDTAGGPLGFNLSDGLSVTFGP